MAVHNDIQELIPIYALGALDAEEAARVKAHLATCELCGRLLEEYRPVADALAFAVPLAEPPRDLKSRAMRRALRPVPARASRPVVRPVPWWLRFSPAPLLAGAALVIALLAIGLNLWQSAELQSQLTTQRDFITTIAYAQGTALDIHGTAAAPQVDGKLYLDPDSTVAALVTVNLPPTTASQVYQVWLTASNGAVLSGGTFSTDPSGNGWLLVHAPQHLGTYTAVEVTLEPRGGSPAPSTAPLLQAALTPR